MAVGAACCSSLVAHRPPAPLPTCALSPRPPEQLCLGDLAHYLAGRPCERLSEREAAWIVQQVLAALAACHRAGLAYRDIKPHNLLLRGVDASGRPSLVLADFGCARSTADVPPSAHVSAGTPLYSAPECVHGTGGMHSDVWSVGVLLYSLLTGGRFPFCDPKHSITQVGSRPLAAAAATAAAAAAARDSAPGSPRPPPRSSRRASTGAAWQSRPSASRGPCGTACRPGLSRCCAACWSATAAGAPLWPSACRTRGLPR